ncbi:MAG: hypothetical protein ACLFRD_04195 [Nitriliruptoraceae bacterium]
MGHRSGCPDLVAFHPDASQARATISRLSRAGIDGGAIELLGRSLVVTAGRYGDRQTDRGSSLALARLVIRGGMVGSVPGAIFGAVLLAVVRAPELAVTLAGAGGGAFLGGAVGVLTGLLTAPTMVTSWERTFAPMVPGPIAIGVRIERERDAERVRRMLSSAASVELRAVADLDELADAPLEPSDLPRSG